MSEAICSKRGSSAGRKASGMCSWALLRKLLAGHLGRRAPKDLTAPLPWVYQLRAARDQRLPGADRGHVGMGVFAPVPDRVEQLRIEASQAGQVLKASISSVLRLFE